MNEEKTDFDYNIIKTSCILNNKFFNQKLTDDYALTQTVHAKNQPNLKDIIVHWVNETYFTDHLFGTEEFELSEDKHVNIKLMKFLIGLTDKKSNLIILDNLDKLESLRKTQEIVFWTLMLEKIIKEDVYMY